MAYEDYASAFVDAQGDALNIQVSESCIESAEFIIRTIAMAKNGGKLVRNNGPAMWAEFENIDFNASEEDIMTKEGARSYKFAALPQVGEGIILLRRKLLSEGKKTGYNMHLGAILARNETQAVISNMFQVVEKNGTAPLKVIQISSAADFAQQTFGKGKNGEDLYAAGLLTAKFGTHSRARSKSPARRAGD
jgi:hypothetical protein